MSPVTTTCQSEEEEEEVDGNHGYILLTAPFKWFSGGRNLQRAPSAISRVLSTAATWGAPWVVQCRYSHRLKEKKKGNCNATTYLAKNASIWTSSSFNSNWLRWIVNSGLRLCTGDTIHLFFVSPILFRLLSSSLQKCILCLTELGDHFFILHAALASGVSSSKEIGRQEKVEHLSHAEVNLLKWWDLVREEVENPRFATVIFFPPSFFLTPSTSPSRSSHPGESKILGAEPHWQDGAAMHKLKRRLCPSLTVWCADNASCMITFHHCC